MLLLIKSKQSTIQLKTKKIKTRWILIRHDKTFNSASFFWGKVVKVKEVRLTALNKDGQVIVSMVKELG